MHTRIYVQATTICHKKKQMAELQSSTTVHVTNVLTTTGFPKANWMWVYLYHNTFTAFSWSPFHYLCDF